MYKFRRSSFQVTEKRPFPFGVFNPVNPVPPGQPVIPHAGQPWCLHSVNVNPPSRVYVQSPIPGEEGSRINECLRAVYVLSRLSNATYAIALIGIGPACPMTSLQGPVLPCSDHRPDLPTARGRPLSRPPLVLACGSPASWQGCLTEAVDADEWWHGPPKEHGRAIVGW